MNLPEANIGVSELKITSRFEEWNDDTYKFNSNHLSHSFQRLSEHPQYG